MSSYEATAFPHQTQPKLRTFFFYKDSFALLCFLCPFSGQLMPALLQDPMLAKPFLQGLKQVKLPHFFAFLPLGFTSCQLSEDSSAFTSGPSSAPAASTLMPQGSAGGCVALFGLAVLPLPLAFLPVCAGSGFWDPGKVARKKWGEHSEDDEGVVLQQIQTIYYGVCVWPTKSCTTKKIGCIYNGLSPHVG